MANDKKFIVKNGLLTPNNAVIGSTTDNGVDNLQVTGSSLLTGKVAITQSDRATPSLDVRNTGGYLIPSIVAQFRGDTDSLQIKNVGVGDYSLVNGGQENGIIFYDNTSGLRFLYNGGARLDINSTGNNFTGLTSIDGNRVITTADEGANNGFDADTVDGLEADQFLRSDTDDTMNGNLTITGNLTVQGTTTTINTETILLADNIITLNSNYTGSTPSENAGIEVERGSLVNALLQWNESNDYWEIAVGGTTGRILTTGDTGSGNGLDSDLLDGLDSTQFLRSDVDDVANGNITILKDLTIGDNVAGAQIIFNGANQDRVLYSENGEIGFLNAGFNWTARSDASGNWIVENDVRAEQDVIADRDVIAKVDVEAWNNVNANNNVAAVNNVTAGQDVIASNEVRGNEIFSTTDVNAGVDVVANNNVTAGNDVIADNDVLAKVDVEAWNNVNANNDVTAGNDVIATSEVRGNEIFATTNVNAGINVIANNNVTAANSVIASVDVSAGNNVSATNDVTAGNNVSAANNVIATNDVEAGNNVSATNDVLAGNDIIADNDVLAKVDVNAWNDVNANNNVTAGGDIIAGGNISAGGTVTANGDVIGARFVDSDDNTYYLDPASNSRLNDISLVGEIIHDGDTDTYLEFNDENSFRVVTGGTARLTANNTQITASVPVYASAFYDSDNGAYFFDGSNTSTSLTTAGKVLIGNVTDAARANDNTGTGGITLASHASLATGQNSTIEISGSNGGYPLLSLNRIDVGNNPYNNSNRFIQFYSDGNARSKLSTDNPGNLYLILGAGLQNGTWDSSGNGLLVVDEGGDVIVGDSSATYSTSDANTSFIDTPDANKLHVNGSIQLNGVNGILSLYTADGANTAINEATFVAVNELGFSAGGGFYMDETTTIKVRNNKNVSSSGDAYFARLIDFNDNTYLVDPAGNSVMNDITLEGEIIHNGDTNTYLQFNAADSFRVVTGGSERLLVNNTYVLANNQMRSPIFYDSANTSFYGDFDGTSLLRYLDVYSSEGTGNLNVGRNVNERIRLHVTDSVGYIQYWQDETDATDHSFRFEILSSSTGTNRFTFNRPIALTAAGDAAYIFARRFVDADNNNFYVDPASTSVMAQITLPQNPVGTGYFGVATQPTYYIGQTSGDNDGWKIYSESPSGTNTGNFIIQSEDDYDANETIRLRFKKTYGDYATKDALIARVNSVDATDSFRAPIFYDLDNTAWYTDPDSTSRMSIIGLGASNVLLRRPTGDYGSLEIDNGGLGGYEGLSIGGRMVFMHDNADRVGVYNDVDNEWIWYADRNNAMRLMYDGVEQARTENGYFFALNAMYAPIYYDSNDPTYYTDQAGTSIHNIQRANRYEVTSADYYITTAAGNYGTIRVEGVSGSSGTWAGYAIRDDWVFMSDGATNAGIYNDTDNEWSLLATRNAGTDLYFNGVKQAETENGYFLATNQMRAPIYYDSNNTAYYVDPAGSTAAFLGGRIFRQNFAANGGSTNYFLEAEDRNHWIWSTATNWGIFWATEGTPAYSYFSSGNANEIVFVGSGNVRASIDLDNGNAFFDGEVFARNYNLNGGNENISLNPAYGSGGADLVLFDMTPYFEARVIRNIQGSENFLTSTTSEYVRVTDAPFAGSYAIQTSAYRDFYSDYIPVVPGEEIYGEISVKYISGSGGLLYYGVERFDSQKRPIAGNEGTTYFVVSAVNYTSGSWTTYRGHTTIPTSHTPYNGSDGGGCYYVRIRILLNYNAGGALRQFGGIMLKRRNAESNLLVDDLYALDRIDAVGVIESQTSVNAPIFYDRDDTNYYLDPTSTSIIRRLKVNTTGSSSGTRALTIKQDGQAEINFGSYPASWTSALQIQNNNNTDIIWISPLDDGYNARFRTGGSGLDFYTDGTTTDTGTHSAFIGSGYVQGISSVRGPIFYDSNDTNYYVDPNSESRMNYIRLYNNNAMYFSSTGVIEFNRDSNSTNVGFRMMTTGSSFSDSSSFGVLALQRRNHNNSATSAGAGLYFELKHSDGNPREYAGIYGRKTVAGTGGGELVFMTYERAEQAYLNSDYFYHVSDIRTPIFYDSNNTGFYGDFASTSRMNTVTADQFNIADMGEFITFYGDDSSFHSISSRNESGGAADDIRINSYGSVFINLDSNNNNSSAADFRIGRHGSNTGSIQQLGLFDVYGDALYVYSAYSFRSPIFYDSNNTNYYGDFASLSSLYDLQLRGWYARTFAHSGSDFPNGTLVRTSMVANQQFGDSFVLECTGKSYSGDPPFSFMAQGYLYNNAIINFSGQHFGKPGFTQMKIFELGGVLCFWWPNVSYWNSFAVHVRNANGDDRNLVTSIENSSEPGGTKKVTVDMKVTAVYNQNINTGAMYATIYYDSDNPGYYGNFAGFSRMNEVSFDRINLVGGGPAYFYTPTGALRGYIRATETDDSHFEFATSGGEDFIFRDGGFGGSWNMIIRGNGDVLTERYHYAQLYYDRNNTSYYVDPASTSQLHYVLADNWFRPQGCTGLYFQSYGHGLWSPECEGNPYGNVATYGGGRNGWRGYGLGSRWTLMTTNGDNIGIHDNSRGNWLWYWNGSYTQWNFGYNYFAGDVRSWRFYDHDTSYYGDFNSDTNWQGLTARGQAMIGLPGTDRSGQRNNYGRRPNITGDSNYWTGAHGWGTVDLNTVGDWGSGFFDTWSNPGNQPAGTSHWVGVQAYHYTNGSARYGWQMAGGPIAGAWWRNTWSGYSGWRKIVMYGLNEYSTDLWATIMYDSNDSGYYCDPNGTNRFNSVDANIIYNRDWFRNYNSGQGLYNQSTGMHIYSNNGYIKMAGGGYGYGGVIMYQNYESSLRGFTGYWDGSGFGMLNSSGNWQIRIEYGNANMELYRVTFANDMRAYIYYDRDNTGYYGDFNNTSRFNYIVPNRIKCVNNVNNEPRWDFSAYVMEAQHWYGNNGSMTMYLGESNYINIRNVADVWGDVRSPIYYDRNNTGYYCDPTGSSQLGAVFATDWFRPQGCTGVYWQSYGRGIWSPECQGNSYGNVTTYAGGRNGWQGWGIGSRHVFMSTGGDNVGVHDNSRGWIWYWNGGATYFDHGFTQFAGSARAPIFYDSNDTGYYIDPNSYSEVSMRQRGGIFIGPNAWGTYTRYSPVSGRIDGYAHFTVTNGNIHIDSQSGYSTFIEYYTGNQTSMPHRFNVGFITDWNDSNYYIDQNGVSRFNVIYYWALYYNSDASLKKDIVTIDDALNKVLNLRGVNYRWKSHYLDTLDGPKDDGLKFGFIAQEVRAVIPDAVTGEEGTLAVDTNAITPILVEAIKDLKAQIDELKAEIALLKSQ